MLAKGVPSAYITVMMVIYLTTLLGFAKKVTQELALLLGRSPRTVRDYARDYREHL
jgi:predicted transcriptional regulator